MPFVTVNQMQDTLTPEQARTLIERITEVCVEVEGEHIRPLTLVMIEETLRPGHVSVGGRILGPQGKPR